MRSAAVAVRALVMLACVVAIPALAMSGTSWQEVLKKFQNYRWPAILNRASASSTTAETEAPRFAPPCSLGGPTVAHNAGEPSRSSAAEALFPASSRRPSPTSSTEPATDDLASVGIRLQRLGATYYLLESWGNQQQLFRFHCKVAVGGKADYVRCFEAVDANPRQAMLEVLRQVEEAGEAARRPQSAQTL